MSDLPEQFVYLEAEAKNIRGQGLLSRAVPPVVHGRDVLVAIDVQGDKHLLVPCADEIIRVDRASQGVTLNQRVLQVDGESIAFADLHCRIPRLDLVFERLAGDVVARLEVDSSKPVATCRQVLDEWRTLLRAAGATMPHEVIQGLAGELEILRLLAEIDPANALDCWDGPSGSLHDFVCGTSHIEVKSTASNDPNFVTVSGVDQLDPIGVEQLYLAVVHLRSDAAAPSLTQKMDAIAALGVPREELLRKVASVGYVYDGGQDDDLRFRVMSVRLWKVGSRFPGLRRSDIGEVRLKGVAKVKYELALDSAPPRIADTETVDVLSSFLANNG